MVRPDPIPNSAVKHSLADGSSPIGSARVGSRQFFNKKPEKIFSGFLLLDAYEFTLSNRFVCVFVPDHRVDRLGVQAE